MVAGVPSWYCRPASNSTGPGHSQECSAGVPPGQLACKHGGSGWGVVVWASPRCTGGWCPIFTLKSSQDYWVKRDMFWFMCTHVLHRNDCSEDWSSCEGTSSQISAGPRHQPHRSFYVYLALPHAALWLFHFLCLFLFIV